MGTCAVCGSFTTLLLDSSSGSECPPNQALKTFLIGDEELPAASPPWIRLHRLSSDSPWERDWRFVSSSCSTCNARTVCRLMDWHRGSVNEFTLCLGCGLVVLTDKSRGGNPDRPPIEGINWNPPCLAVKKLRRAAFRRIEIPPWLRPDGWHS